ncbi:MAG: DUF2059 domain-containing protein [Kiritimatiellae bacterium]|nr:DUF2059 domain-containing protein [Kiritimatiellia bacterium]
MKLKIALLAIAIALPMQMFAVTTTQATAQDKAKELMKILNISKSIDSSFAEVSKFSSQMIKAQDLSPEEKVKAKQYMEKSMTATFSEMKTIDWDKMFADVYASVFTAEEIDGLIKFYKSPLGQKLLAKEPELTKATMQKMQVEMAKIMPKLQANMAKAISEAQAEEKQAE